MNDVHLHLVNPYTTSTGKTYYYLDASGDGLQDTRESAMQSGVFDAVSHQVLDDIFNSGSDTSDSLDSRSITLGEYTLTLPSASEFQELWQDVQTYGPGWNSLYHNDFEVTFLSMDPSLTLEGDVSSSWVDSSDKHVYFDGAGDGLIVNDTNLLRLALKILGFLLILKQIARRTHGQFSLKVFRAVRF